MARLFSTVFFLTMASLAAADQPGIVREEPKQGRFVRTDMGYMVPYEVSIPGTGESFRMEPIPAGRFRMGSPPNEPGRDAIEGPQIEVLVREPFWMAQCEVTQGQYREYMAMFTVFKKFAFSGRTRVTDENRVDAVTAPTTLYEPALVFENGDHVEMPMVCVTLFAAKQYSKWLSKATGSQFRLPTEAEWEYACRAGSTTAYSFGDDPNRLAEYAWFKENSYEEGLRKVATKKPNAWGLYDMHGNVAEWVHDHCAAYRDPGRVRDSVRDWVRTDQLDPRSVRGGSWLHTAEGCRSASRLKSNHRAWQEYDPELPRSPWWFTNGDATGIGIRLVRPLREMTPSEKTDFWEASNESTRIDVKDSIRWGRGTLGLASPELMREIAASRDKE